MKSWKLGLAILVVLIALAVAPATAQTFDNSGGGSWKEYMSFPLTSPITEYAQYKIVINGTTWELYNVTGSLEASGTNDNFWSLVQSDGDDIRVFNQTGQQLYFWIELFDYTNKTAIIWVNVTPHSIELNVAYGNPDALPSAYNNGKKTFYAFDDFDIHLAKYVIAGFTRGVEEPTTFRLFVSTDGISWREIPNINYTGLPEGDSVRDPSIIRYNGKWWIVHTAQAFNDYQDHFDVAVSDDLVNWTFVTKVDCSNITGGRQGARVWAPEFFIDDDGSVHVYVAIYSGLSGDHFKIYELHPLDENMTTWSEPVEVFSISGIDVIDPFMIKENGTYYLWYKDNTNRYIEYATGTSPTGPFTQQVDDDWAGWGQHREGVSLVKINETTWRIYIDFYTNANPVGIYYSESSDGFQTWTSPQLAVADIQHPTIIDITSVNHHSDEAMSVEEDVGIPWIVKRNGGFVKYENNILKISSSDKGTHINAKIDGGLQNVLIRTKVKVVNNGEAFAIGVTDGTVNLEDANNMGNFYNGYSFTFNGFAFAEDRQRIIKWSDGSRTDLATTSQYLLENGLTYTIDIIYASPTLKMFRDGELVLEANDNTYPSSSHIAILSWQESEYWVYWIFVAKLTDPADFGTPLVKLLQKKFGTETIYVNVTYLDTSVTERYNPIAYYNLEDKPQINVTSMLSVSGVNATYGANISIELIDFVTLDKVVYNGTEVSVTYQGTVTNSTTGYVYNVYSFTTYEDGTLEIYGHVGNKAYEATFKLDGETVDVFNVTAVVGEPLEILLPHAGNVTIASAEYTGVTSVSVNTKDLGVGAKTLVIKIEDPENFTVGYRYGTVNIDWGKIYFNIMDLQNKTFARTTYGFFNKNFSILSTDPTKLYAGDIEIDVYFNGVKLKSLEIYLNHTNNGLTLNVSVNATQFKDYRNVTRIIASPNYFEVVNLSTKYPFSVMKLVNVSGTIVIDYVSNAPTSVKVEGATSYTYEKPVLKITASGNVTVTDLYRLSIPLKDRLGNPVNFYVLINGSRVDASAGKASKLLKPSWYEVEVPITVAGFELWKFNDSSNIVLVEINTSDKTLPTAEYRVPSKIETKEVRIQKTKFPWLPFPIPFLSESKPAQEETPIVRLEGTLKDFYNAPVPNRTIKIVVASPNFTRIYNVTTDESGNFKIDVDMARGVEYKVTYKFAGDDVYVGTSTTKTFTIEQLLPAPPEEMTIEELLIFVGIAVGLIAVVAGAIYLAKRTKAKTLARMESEFRFFRRLK